MEDFLAPICDSKPLLLFNTRINHVIISSFYHIVVKNRVMILPRSKFWPLKNPPSQPEVDFSPANNHEREKQC